MPLANRFTIEPIWKGATAIIIGGGPSLSLKQIRAIAIAKHRPASPFRVIAVNDAIFPAWYADWLHACDTTWWFQHIQSVHTFPGIRTTLAEDVPEPWVTGYLENSGENGFDPDPSCCRTGANSVYQAMCIAIHTGAKKIVLVGVDMKNSATGDQHWFGDHPMKFGNVKADYAATMIPHFKTILPALEARGVEVVNASPGSALTLFPTVDLDTVLRG